MPIFFAGIPGRTAVLSDPAVQGTLSLVTTNPYLGYASHRTIITRFSHSERCNVQFLHTMGNQIYVYVFGDRVGSLTLSGISVAGDCSDSGAAHGAELALSWYWLNRASYRQAPVRFVLGSRTAFDGFVTGVSQEAVDSETRLVQFGIEVQVPPEGN